jgi:hypothetical protein
MEIPMLLMAVGTTASAVGVIQQGREAKKEADFQARQMVRQSEQEQTAAVIAATNARQAEADGMRERADILRQRARFMGTQRAAVAKAGLVLSGSAQYAMEDSGMEFRRMADQAILASLGQAGNLRAESSARAESSSNLLLSAHNARRSGRAAQTTGLLRGFGTLASGYGQVAGMKA